MKLPFIKVWVLASIARDRGLGDPRQSEMFAAYEIESGTYVELNLSESPPASPPPFDLDADTLFVCFHGEADFGVFVDRNWPLPERVIDLYVELRCRTNGHVDPDKLTLKTVVAALGYKCCTEGSPLYGRIIDIAQIFLGSVVTSICFHSTRSRFSLYFF